MWKLAYRGGGCGAFLNPRKQTFFDQNPGFNDNFLNNPNPIKIPHISQNPKSDEFSFKNLRSSDTFFQYSESKIKLTKIKIKTIF